MERQSRSGCCPDLQGPARSADGGRKVGDAVESGEVGEHAIEADGRLEFIRDARWEDGEDDGRNWCLSAEPCSARERSSAARHHRQRQRCPASRGRRHLRRCRSSVQECCCRVERSCEHMPYGVSLRAPDRGLGELVVVAARPDGRRPRPAGDAKL